MAQYERAKVSSKSYIYVEGTSSPAPDEVSAAMGKAFCDVTAFMEKKKIKPSGFPLSVYTSFDPNIMRFRAGVFVSKKDAAKASGKVKAGETPAGEVVRLVYTGPYTGLSGIYTELMSDMVRDGLQMCMPTWEVYHNDPAQTPPEKLVTEINIALAK